MKKIFYILMLLTLSNSAFAQNKCAQLFEISRQQQIETQIQKNMKRYGYWQEGKTIFKTDSTGNKVRIGEIKVIEPKYLFEWADQDMHDYWKSNGKYTKADMDFTLKQPGQATGRGYYVSTNPMDSREYGTHLTIFKVNEPLLIIDNLYYSFYEDQKTLNELRKIGFVGNQGNQKTWLNIFNENILSEIVPLDQNIFDDIKKYDMYDENIFTQKPQFMKLLIPEISLAIEKIIEKLENDFINYDEFKLLSFYLSEQPKKINISQTAFPRLLYIILIQNSFDFNHYQRLHPNVLESLLAKPQFFQIFKKTFDQTLLKLEQNSGGDSRELYFIINALKLQKINLKTEISPKLFSRFFMYDESILAIPVFANSAKIWEAEMLTQLNAKTITDSDLLKLLNYASQLKSNPYTLENIDFIFTQHSRLASTLIYSINKAPYREKLVQQWMLRFIRNEAKPSYEECEIFKEFSSENKLVLTQADFDRLGKKFDSDNNPAWARKMNLVIK